MAHVSHRAFTLIELMLVVAIMALMGSVSVGGYRAMRRGMEERGVMQNVNQFIRNAYQRAMIDRQPTAVYFWNETLREESDDGDTLLVVGRAVAVRQSGRVTKADGNHIVDEFGDLAQYASDSDDESESSDGMSMSIYKMASSGTLAGNRALVGVSTVPYDAQSTSPMLAAEKSAGEEKQADEKKVTAYAFLVNGGSWSPKAGEAYGLEFANLTLPNNYIFGSDFNTRVSASPNFNMQGLFFSPTSSAGGQTVRVSALRVKGGSMRAVSVGDTVSPDSALKQQTE